ALSLNTPSITATRRRSKSLGGTGCLSSFLEQWGLPSCRRPLPGLHRLLPDGGTISRSPNFRPARVSRAKQAAGSAEAHNGQTSVEKNALPCDGQSKVRAG